MIIGFFSILITAFESCFAETQSGRNTRFFPFSSGFKPINLQKTSHHNRGYTLIELLVVLVILSLILGITIPKFRQALLSDSLDATSLKLIGLVQDLRERAVSSNVSYILHFDIRNNRIWFFPRNGSEEEQEIARERAVELPEDIRIEDVWSWRSGTFYDEAVILFSRKGYVEQSMIHLQSEDGREMSLELTPFLGSVKIHEGYVDIGRG